MTFIPATPAGPIFATLKINGLDCLELIGVVKGCLGKRPENVTALNGDKLTGLFQHSGFATIAPLDDLMPPREVIAPYLRCRDYDKISAAVLKGTGNRLDRGGI